MAGFVGDIGDLSKILMAKNGLRDMNNVDDKLAHELSDCLWSNQKDLGNIQITDSIVDCIKDAFSKLA